MFSGGITYPLYTLTLYMYLLGYSENWIILAGTILGVGASFLWTVQGFIMLAYSTPSNRGRMISFFWIIYNCAGILGGILCFAINFNSTSEQVSPITYLTFISLALFGCCFSVLLLPFDKVQKEDLSSVNFSSVSFRDEISQIYSVFFNYRMVLLIPAFLLSDFPITYQVNVFSSFVFNVRTRGLINIFSFICNCCASFLVGKVLDRRHPNTVLGIILFLFNSFWFSLYFVQKQYERTDSRWDIDFTSPQFALYFVLYLIMSISICLYHNWISWIIPEISSDPKAVSRNFAFFIGFRSIGSATSWLLDALQISFMNQLTTNWCLVIGCLPGMYLSMSYIKKTSSLMHIHNDSANEELLEKNDIS
jgi:hypothetical protein